MNLSNYKLFITTNLGQTLLTSDVIILDRLKSRWWQKSVLISWPSSLFFVFADCIFRRISGSDSESCIKIFCTVFIFSYPNSNNCQLESDICRLPVNATPYLSSKFSTYMKRRPNKFKFRVFFEYIFENLFKNYKLPWKFQYEFQYRRILLHLWNIWIK